jgi:gas vesicle protein
MDGRLIGFSNGDNLPHFAVSRVLIFFRRKSSDLCTHAWHRIIHPSQVGAFTPIVIPSRECIFAVKKREQFNFSRRRFMNEQFSHEGSTLKESMAVSKDEVKAQAREMKDSIKTKTKEAITQAKESGGEYVQYGKERTASRISGFGESMRQAADRFEEEQDPNIARYTRLLADKLDNAALYVRERDLNELRRDGENLARQYPAIFFGSCFVAGLVAARFLKASAQRKAVAEEVGEDKNFGHAMEDSTGTTHETVTAGEGGM